jgi:hypothetical protein
LYRDVESQVEYATGERKSAIQRLVDGDIEASTGDITDAAWWQALESGDEV